MAASTQPLLTASRPTVPFDNAWLRNALFERSRPTPHLHFAVNWRYGRNTVDLPSHALLSQAVPAQSGLRCPSCRQFANRAVRASVPSSSSYSYKFPAFHPLTRMTSVHGHRTCHQRFLRDKIESAGTAASTEKRRSAGKAARLISVGEPNRSAKFLAERRRDSRALAGRSSVFL